MRTIIPCTPHFFTRTLAFGAAFACSFFMALPSHAAWDGTPYAPGETLDPECAPNAANCGVGSDSVPPDTSGDWTGTLDGHEGLYYLDRANQTGTQTASTISDFAAAVGAAIGGLTTASLPEGGNLYFTDARVRDYLDSLDQGYFFSTTSANAWAAAEGLSSGSSGPSELSTTTSDYWLSTKTTDDIAEGSRLYFTQDRARESLSVIGAGLAYDSALGILSLASGYGIPRIASTTSWNSFHDAPSSRIAAGTNLSWNGLTLNGPSDAYLRSLITASGPLSYATTSGVLTLAQAGASSPGYLSSGDWNAFTAKLASSSLSGGTGIGYNPATGVITNSGVLSPSGDWTGTLDGHEGLYYLDRANQTGTQTASTISDFTSAVAGAIGGLTTDALAEGDTNLYYTPTHFNDSFASKTTSDLAEGSRLYFTQDRARAALSASGAGLSYDGEHGIFSVASGYAIPRTSSTTAWDAFYASPSSRIAAGTNLSWNGLTLNGPSDAYMRSLLSAAGPLSYATSSGAFALTQAGASSPGYLSSVDWNVFAAKLASSSLSAGAGISYDPATGAIANTGVVSTAGDWAGIFDGHEGIYYLARANQTGMQTASTISDFAAAVGAAIGGLTTDALAEGSRQYFTQDRARAALSSGSAGLSYDASTGVLSIASGYALPLSASTTEWQAAYQTRIVSATAPLSISGNTLSIAAASSSQAGYLTAADWSAFNGKERPLSFAYPLARTGDSVSIAFGTTTANTWSGSNSFSGGLQANALSVGSLSGLLVGTNGVVSATTTVPIGWGGTGLASAPSLGQVLVGNSSGGYSLVATSSLGLAGAGAGTVTSVGLSAPIGFSVSGSPITGSGTLALSFLPGYALSLTASTTNWNAFYDAPSSRIAAGTNLSWSGLTLNGPSDAYMRSLITASGPLSYASSTGALAIATSSAAAGAGVTVSGIGALVGSSGITITNTGVLSVSCTTITCSGTNPAAFSIGIGAISNAQLANASVTVTAGTGLSGGGAVSLGAAITLSNAGVLSLGPSGQGLSGAIAVSTSTASFNGLTFGETITSSGGTLTWQPSVSGTLGIAGGGTGTTTFLAGGVVFGNGTRLTQSSAVANFYWDESNKRLGIGTAAPGTALDVNGDITTQNVKSCSGVLTALGTNAAGKIVCIGISLSDARLKSDVAPLADQDGLALVNSLAPVSYYWKDPSVYGGTDALQYGFIAQDAAAVAPNLVGTTSETSLTPGGSKYFNYLGIIAPLVKAVQQMDAKFSALADSIATKEIHTDELCVGDVCVTQAQFLRMAEQGGAPEDEPPPASNDSESPGDATTTLELLPGGHIIPDEEEEEEEPVPEIAPDAPSDAPAAAPSV